MKEVFMSGNGVRVLFVDDEPSIRMTLSAILERAGFQVTVAATVPEALDHMGKEKFDLLLSDLNIGQPGDGFTVISAMRRSQPEVATIILTGFPDFDTALQALRSQVDDYLTKPTDVNKLLSVLNENLRKPKRHTPVQVKRVSTVLRENANQIVESWFTAATQDREISRVSLSKRERIDHLPAILAELAERVDSNRFEGGNEASEAARAHGQERRHQGYTARQVVAEARILHNIVSNTVQEHLLSIDMSTLTSDLMQFGESLHEQLEASIQAFDEEVSYPRPV
jgi:YesN/AraC family two-component response regulator